MAQDSSKFLMLGRPQHNHTTGCRYLKLLQSGAHETDLDHDYTEWLNEMACVPNKERGDEYYTAPDGSKVKVES